MSPRSSARPGPWWRPGSGAHASSTTSPCQNRPDMLLAVNVGNTETKLGVFRDRELSFSRRIGTHPERTADELALLFGGFLEQEGLSFSRMITGVAISSVVPSMTQSLRDMTERYFHFEPVVVGAGVKTGMAVLTDNPREVGADRIVNGVAA